MSYLNVTNVSHSFGGRQILENVSFKLLRGEHVGLVGANGEGKSTFLNIVTGHVLPDEGKVEWPGKVTVGYLDQQSTLEKGMTIREVLRTAFDGMYAMEQQMLELYDKMGDASPEELDKMMNTVGEIQSELEHSGFYSLIKTSASFPAVSAARFCLLSCCCRTPKFCCWTSLLTILTLNISNGSQSSCRTTSMPSF